MADDDHPIVFPATKPRLLPPPPLRPGGAALPSPGPNRRFGRKKRAHRTQPALGGTYYEEGLMHTGTFCGGQLGYICLLIAEEM